MTFSKILLSASISGKRISVPSGNFVTGTSGALIHTAEGVPSSLDEVYIYAANSSASDGIVVTQWGGYTASGDFMFAPVPAQNGRVLLSDGQLLSSGLSIYAMANTSGITIDGFCNRIS